MMAGRSRRTTTIPVPASTAGTCHDDEPRHDRSTIRRPSTIAAVTAAVLLVGAQFVPYGRNHTNPPVISEPNWSSSATRDLAAGACFDCHSNETRWPWYANIAPMSWLMQRDVEEGRDELNWSEWEQGEEDGEDMVETILEGEMPPWRYRLAHGGARLSESETAQLVEGLISTFGRDD